MTHGQFYLQFPPGYSRSQVAAILKSVAIAIEQPNCVTGTFDGAYFTYTQEWKAKTWVEDNRAHVRHKEAERKGAHGFNRQEPFRRGERVQPRRG